MEITHKIRTSFKTLASKRATTWRLKNLRVKLIFHEKYCIPVITQNKKRSSKQVVPIRYTLEKRVIIAATFKDLCDVSFETK